MIDFGWDLRNVIWIFLGISLAFPLSIISPHSLPFLIGGGLMWFGLKQLIRYKSLKSWKIVQGGLIKTDIGFNRISVGQYSEPSIYFFPLAYFSYQYDGDDYKCNSFAFDKKSVWSLDEGKAKSAIKDLERLEALEVYVNPANPQEAALIIEISRERISHSYALLVAGALVIAKGVVLFIYK